MLGRYNLYDIPLFSQLDSRWRNVKLGFSPNLTIGSHGCVVCGLAMLLCGIGYDVDPAKVNEDMRKAKAFMTGTGRAIWARVTDAYPLLKYSYQVIYDRRAPDIKFIGSLADKLPVMTELILPNGNIHWVLAVRREVKGFSIHDPLLPPQAQKCDYLHALRPGAKIRRIVVYAL